MKRKVIPWSEEEDNYIKELYPDTDREILVEKLGRTWKAIKLRAMKFRVKRSPDIVKKDNVKYTKKAMLAKYGVEYSTQLPSMKEKSRKTNIRKRGVEYPSQSKEVRDKIKRVVQKKYGVDNVFQAPEIKEKSEKTNIERYGVKNPTQNKDIREKSEKTNIERYGVSNPFQMTDRVKKGMMKKYGEESPLRVPEILQKAKDTSILRYGTTFPNQNKDVREKIERTNLKRYGFTTPFKSRVIKRKIIKTNIRVYGKTNPAKNETIKNKVSKTCMERYGIKSFLCIEEVRRKGRELAIQRNSIGISQGEVTFEKYLIMIDSKTEHQKEHPILKQVIDFYMPTYDLWVQYDGDYWHGKDQRKNKNTRQYKKIQKTIERDSLQNSSVFNLIRFWSSDVIEAIKMGSVFDLIVCKIEKKLGNNICHQFLKKLEWYNDDIEKLPFNPDEIKANDFNLQKETLSDEIKDFIIKYEWLGSIGFNVKWCFTARYMGILSGVVLISEPTSYSTLIGKETPIYEAIIQRGATVSWSPRNLGSKLIMFSCHWMVDNTPKRLFVGYADPKANERGTIYRACNFDYIGDNFGDIYSFTHPKITRTFSSRYLRRTSTFKIWCRDNNIELKPEWFKENQFKDLSKIPEDIKNRWYSWGRTILKEAKKTKLSKKSKYLKLIGKDKRELSTLKKRINYTSLPYPFYAHPPFIPEAKLRLD